MSKKSVTKTITRIPRVHRDHRRRRRRRPSALRRRLCRVRRRNPETVSACRLFSGRIHLPLICRTRLPIERPPPSALIRRHPARPSFIHRCIFRVDYYHLIHIILFRTCIPSCCRIIFCRRTCTRCCAAFIRVIQDCIRPTRRTACIILIRSAMSTAASNATRCSARRTVSRYICTYAFLTRTFFPKPHNSASCFDSFLICLSLTHTFA